MKNLPKQIQLALVLALVCVLPTLIPVAVLANGAIPSSSQGGVFWQVTVPNDGVSLRVGMPDGSVFEQNYQAGQSPMFSPQSGVLPDGAYTWELVMSPVVSPEERAKAVRSRESGQSVVLASGTVESGTFRVVRGSVMLPNTSAVEPGTSAQRSQGPSAPADFVIADDLVVQGSGCVGVDCVNGEDFGFDTIRLKENNTRFQFNDTSTGSFPTNNWQIRANSSASGGGDFLGFVDQGADGTSETGTIVLQVSAGAPVNSLFVNSSGNVGFGTGVPAVKLHATNGNTPTLRLEQNTSSGFTAQTWDVAGHEGNFFIRDVTNGSLLPFRIQPAAPSNSVFVAASGNVGFGTASPAAKVEASTADGNGTRWRLTQSGGAVPSKWDLKNNADTGRLTFSDDETGARVPFKFGPGSVNNLLRVGVATVGTVDVNGTLTVNGTFNNNSSREFKDILPSIDSLTVLAKISSLPLFTWSYKNDDGVRHFGPVAEDFWASFGLGTDDKHISPNDMAGVALAATQALNVLLAEKDAEIKELKERLARLESRLGSVP